MLGFRAQTRDSNSRVQGGIRMLTHTSPGAPPPPPPLHTHMHTMRGARQRYGMLWLCGGGGADVWGRAWYAR